LGPGRVVSCRSCWCRGAAPGSPKIQILVHLMLRTEAQCLVVVMYSGFLVTGGATKNQFRVSKRYWWSLTGMGQRR
jgi:hypothetical protein